MNWLRNKYYDLLAFRDCFGDWLRDFFSELFNKIKNLIK